MVDHLGIPMNIPVAKGWPCGAAMSCAKGELWKGDVGDYERKPTDLYSPSDRGTGEVAAWPAGVHLLAMPPSAVR